MISKTRIEIIALDGKKFFSIGAVEVTSKGEFYVFLKTTPIITKISRHVSGVTHGENSVQGRYSLGKGVPLSEFKGRESLVTMAFGLGSLEEIYTEYKLKKANGIFCIDMRSYVGSAFNLTVSLATEDGLPFALDTVVPVHKRQLYVYADSHPMVCLYAFDANPETNPNIQRARNV